MFNIIVATHGNLGHNLVETVKMFTGETSNLAAVSLLQGSGPDTLSKDLKDSINKCDKNEGVLILVDLMGGTPGNSAIKLMLEEENITVVTGVNLPMLLEAILSRENFNNLIEFSESIKNSAVSGIKLHK